MLVADTEMAKYFDRLERQVKEAYSIAEKARALGHDPELFPEIPMAGDLAERVEKLVGPQGVAEEIRKLEKELPREEIALKVAEMIVDGKFGRFDEQKMAEQAVRTALAVLTEGVVVAPLEGIPEVKIRENRDGTKHLAIYFAAPIRAAGGTAAALSILAADFVRQKMYLDPYKATEREVERFVEEIDLYRSFVAPGQYSPAAEEVRLAVANLPVEVTGDRGSVDLQVSSFRNLERVEHNYLREGAILALSEGIILRASKVLKYVEKFGLTGWAWLQQLAHKVKAPEEEVEVPRGDKYLKEVLAGRSVFSEPGIDGLGRYGGFRLRYGRARTTGIAAIGLHPATMVVCDEFIAAGTQLKTERPGKGGAVTPVSTIEGPIVKLGDGSVVRIESAEEARALQHRISEILFLGDILVGFGEFLENNHPLMPAGYCEEWWAQEVEKAMAGKEVGIDISGYLIPPYPRPPPELAVKISEMLDVPLHPAYTYYFRDLFLDEIFELGKWLASGEAEFKDGALRRLKVKIEEGPKRILEELGVPHRVEAEQVIVEDHALPLCRCLGLLNGDGLSEKKLAETIRSNPTADVLEIIHELAGFKVRDKGGTRIGARMGRPEKAAPRKMDPLVHVLFPIELTGGPKRNILEAAGKRAKVELAQLECQQCGKKVFSRKCPACGGIAEFRRYCTKCGRQIETEQCQICNARGEFFKGVEIDVDEFLAAAFARVGEMKLKWLKGVKGMTSAYKIPEPLEKGILRAKHGVSVFKDGTIRFDATDAPLTHFRPREIGVSVEQLRRLGYERDFHGNYLENEDQMLELKVQDIILTEEGGDYLLKASKFVDDLLQKFYGLPPYYRADSREDLIGHIVIGMAPHTSAGVVGRIIGFTKAKVCYAHPFFHAAKRRDCDGDEDSTMLLLDVLLNFSKRFLPSARGGRMDAPLILNVRVNPVEVDKEAHNMDVMARYPLEFYEATWKYERPSKLTTLIETVEKRLGSEREYTGIMFSFDTYDIAAGPQESRYKQLGEMVEKMKCEMSLAEKIRAVDPRRVAEEMISYHFIRDMRGNIRTFSSQSFRCGRCNKKFRRVPLTGVCDKCNEKLLLTVHRASAEKYLSAAKSLAEKYNLSDYTKQRLMLIEKEIKSTFESDAVRQTTLADFL